MGDLGDRAVDIRLQDALLPFVFVVLLLSRAPNSFKRLRVLWGRGWLLFLAGAVASLTVHLIDGTVAPVRQVAFFFRGIQPFLLTIVIASLYVNMHAASRRGAQFTLLFCAAANAVWILFQLLTNQSTTLFGTAVSEQVESYGPRLIGEPSAFGTGTYFAFIAAVGVAYYRANTVSRFFAVALYLAGIAGTYLSGSRVSFAATLLFGTIIVLGQNRLLRVVRVVAAVLLAGFALSLIANSLTGRLSVQGIESGVEVRITSIWRPLLDAAIESPLVGIGPGSLGTIEFPQTEAHNLLLRAWLDYGLPTTLLMMWFGIRIFLKAWRTGRQSNDLHVRAAAWLAIMYMIAFLIGGFVQDSFSAVTSSHLAAIAIGMFGGELIVKDRYQRALSRLMQTAPSDPGVVTRQGTEK